MSPTSLAGGPKDVAELARSDAAPNEDALYRVLRLLASLGIFDEAAPRRFTLTPAADMLRKDVPGSLRGMAVFLPDPFHFRVYADLMHSVTTGKPAADKTLGMPVFEYLAKNPDVLEGVQRRDDRAQRAGRRRGDRGLRLQRRSARSSTSPAATAKC